MEGRPERTCVRASDGRESREDAIAERVARARVVRLAMAGRVARTCGKASDGRESKGHVEGLAMAGTGARTCVRASDGRESER